MVKYLPGFTLMEAPCEMVCVVFKMHAPPDCGAISILEPEGKLAGGIALKVQLDATFQFPFPMKVYTFEG